MFRLSKCDRQRGRVAVVEFLTGGEGSWVLVDDRSAQGLLQPVRGLRHSRSR